MTRSRLLLLGALAPFGLGLVRLALIGQGIGGDFDVWMAVAGVALGTPILLAMLAPFWPAIRLPALAAPCFLAPLAVWLPWALEPTRMGMAWVELEFFVSWLTRYPNFGPINLEVALGIGCVLGASAMPVLVGLLALRASTRPRALALVTAVALVPWAPAALVLDATLLATALQSPLHALVSSGALVRLAAVLAMLALTLRAAVFPPDPPSAAVERLRRTRVARR